MSDEKRCDCCQRYWYVDDLVSGLCPNCLDFLATKNQMDIEQDQKIKALEHRLSNCIEPKFKYEDYVYAVFTDTDIFKGQIDIFDYYTNRYLVFFGEDIGGEWFGESRIFATEEEARKHLEELKNGN